MRLPSIKLAPDQRRSPDLWIAGAFERTALTTEGLPKRVANTAERCIQRSGFKAREGQVQRAETSGAQREVVEVHGLGNKRTFDERKLRKWLSKVTEEAAREGQRRVVLLMPDHPAAMGGAVMSLITTVLLAGYRFDRFRRPTPTKRLREIRLLPPPGKRATYETALPVAKRTAISVAWARDLANTPPNEATPAWMAEQARDMAGRIGMAIEGLGPAELEAKGMGGITAEPASPRAAGVGRGGGDRGPGRQRGDVRQWRHLHQALVRDGGDEVRQVRSLHGTRSRASGRQPRATDPPQGVRAPG